MIPQCIDQGVGIIPWSPLTVAELSTGEVLSTHLIEPDKTYWRNENKKARPMAGLL